MSKTLAEYAEGLLWLVGWAIVTVRLYTRGRHE